MVRHVFYSFHYKPDNARASQVRNIGAVQGNSPARDNDWETITKGGDKEIAKWIDGQFSGKSCAIILIGKETAGRKWINYEIKKAWNDKKGVLGIYVHNLKNLDGDQTVKGANPFTGFNVGTKKLSSVVKAYDPPFQDSKKVYAHICDNIESWIEEAILIRKSA